MHKLPKFNFLDRRTSAVPAVTTRAQPLRRPGIGKIVAELQIQHPDKSENELNAMAKQLWTERYGNRRSA